MSLGALGALSSLLPHSYDDATKYKIEHTGRVSQPVFETVAGFFFAIALITFVCRIAVRLTIRGRLFIDDYILIFGACALITATVLLYRFSHLIYILNALKYDHTIIPIASDIKAIGNGQGITYSFIAVMWTATCSVKFCFLSVSKVLIKNVSRRITVWYWVTAFLCVVTWALAISVAFIICPYVGEELVQHCTPDTPFAKTWVLQAVVTSLDVITDVMIIAIPIYILRKVRMKLTDKIGLGAVLCLSFAMVIVTIARTGASRYHGFFDLTWEFLVLYLESCISIMMASIAAFRSVFIQHRRQQVQDHPLQDIPVPLVKDDVRSHIRRLRARANADLETTEAGDSTFLTAPPGEGSRIKGILTFINNYGTRTQNGSSVQTSEGTKTPGSRESEGWNKLSMEREDSNSNSRTS